MKTINLLAALAFALAGCATTTQQEQERVRLQTSALQGIIDRERQSIEAGTGRKYADWPVEAKKRWAEVCQQAWLDYYHENRDRLDREFALAQSSNAQRSSAQPAGTFDTTQRQLTPPPIYGGTTTFTPNPLGSGSNTIGTIQYPDGRHGTVTRNPITGDVSVQQY